MLKNMFCVIFILLVFSACKPVIQDSLPTVEVRKEGDHYRLYRNGSPYHIQGAGGYDQLDKLALYGGNSIRTWNTYGADQILDEADSLGITVTLGLEVGMEYWGKDFNYWNFNAIEQKIDELQKIVEKYKDHPALLMWGVGNEVQLFGGNRFLVFYTINRIAKMIHQIDPNHPVMTTVPMGRNFKLSGYLRILLPDVDILGINVFQGLPSLYEEVRSTTGWNKAYILTEWGPPGPWEAIFTEWYAPYENNSSEKAAILQHNYELMELDEKLYLGGYAFYWGNKFERTHTFFSLFPQKGYETESVNVLQKKWSGKNLENSAPRIDSLIIQATAKKRNIYLTADSVFTANIFANDPDNDPLTYLWELRPEGTDDGTVGKYQNNMTHLLIQDNCSEIEFKTPKEEGPYRLFVYVYDGHQHVATDNMPFYVLIK